MVAYLPHKEPYREVAHRDDERDAERELERGEEVVVLVHRFNLRAISGVHSAQCTVLVPLASS